MITRLRYPKGYQFFNANGAPLALGNLYYYVAGTATPQDTYSDSAGEVVNTNPIVLDGSGRLAVDVYLGSAGANYKEVLTTGSATVSPWPDDAIPAAAQPDWNAVSGPNRILNKPDLAPVATSGSYADLSNKPSAFTGDDGSGDGASGLVPAPALGDAAAGKFMKADGTWSVVNLASCVSGSYTVALNATENTSLTLPASGTLATTAQLASLGAVVYQGTWDASTNTPALASGAGAKGHYYKVSVAGTTLIDGISQWNVGDSIIFDGTTWDKIDGISNEVISVAGRTGAVTLSLNDLSNYISADRTIVVATSGGDYTTVADAVAYLNTCVFAAGVTVTLQVNDGVYSSSVPVLITTPFGRSIMLKGQHARTTTVTSVQSSSGWAGSWSIVLNVGSVANIVTGNYVALTGLSGGSNPEYLAGVWPVTNVDAVNTRITISTTHRGSSAPSGAVSGGVKIYTSILSFTNCDGIRVWNGGVGINAQDILLVGNGGTRYGWSIQDGCRLNTNDIAVYGFGTGIYSLYASEINGASVVVSGCQYDGLFANNNGVINFATTVVSGNGANGAHAILGGTIDIPGVVATGNGANGVLAERGGNLNVSNGKATANAHYGFNSIGPAYADTASTTVSGNTAGGINNSLSLPNLQATSSLKVPLIYPKTDGTAALKITKANGSTVVMSFDTTNNRVSMGGDLIQHPSASTTPANNGDLVVEATSNTALTFKLKGSDGTVRSGTLPLS